MAAFVIHLMAIHRTHQIRFWTLIKCKYCNCYRWWVQNMLYYIMSTLVMECNYINGMSRLQVISMTCSLHKFLWQVCNHYLIPCGHCRYKPHTLKDPQVHPSSSHADTLRSPLTHGTHRITPRSVHTF